MAVLAPSREQLGIGSEIDRIDGVVMFLHGEDRLQRGHMQEVEMASS